MIHDPQSKELRQAINGQDYFAAKALLDRGIDPNRVNLKGNTALHRAVITGDMQMVDLVMKYRPDLSIRNRANQTPGSLAEYMGFRDIAQRLGVELPSHQRRLAL